MSFPIIHENQKFPLGQLVATSGALDLLAPEEMKRFLIRHACGDWGMLDKEDRAENERSLDSGYRLLSVYFCRDVKFYIISEADRASTCILLPEEY